MGYTIRTGLRQGRDHVIAETNRQDALRVLEFSTPSFPAAVGVICDGCSQGKHSEVGAQLAAEFLTRQAALFLNGVPVPNLVMRLLYGELLSFLRQVVDTYAFLNEKDRVNFIGDHLLFTVVGFVMTPDKAVIFTAGDGTLIINDDPLFLDQGGSPFYPAYHLVDRRFLEPDATPIPKDFQVWELDLDTTYRFAIGSDVWEHYPDLLNEVWGFKHPEGLQRKMNIWSRQKLLHDDASLITVEFGSPAETSIDAPADDSQE